MNRYRIALPLTVAAVHLLLWIVVCLVLWVRGLSGDGWVLPGLGLVEAAFAYGLVYWAVFGGSRG